MSEIMNGLLSELGKEREYLRKLTIYELQLSEMIACYVDERKSLLAARASIRIRIKESQSRCHEIEQKMQKRLFD